VAKATGKRVLEGITDYLWQQQQNSPMWIKLIDLMNENKFDNVILDVHRNLLDSLRRKDSEQTQKMMCNHFNHTRNIYFDIIGEDEG
jgi:DNA-binding FadR family transcriptional regulator